MLNRGEQVSSWFMCLSKQVARYIKNGLIRISNENIAYNIRIENINNIDSNHLNEYILSNFQKRYPYIHIDIYKHSIKILILIFVKSQIRFFIIPSENQKPVSGQYFLFAVNATVQNIFYRCVYRVHQLNAYKN